MFGSTILDVAVGIIFVYILVSIICSAIREGIESVLKTRAAHLEHGIRVLLADRGGNGLARDLFNHPLVAVLYENDYDTARIARDGQARPWALARGGKMPSYIPSRSFAVALMDLAVRGREITPENSSGGGPVISLQSLRDSVGTLQNEKVQRALLTAIDSAQGDLNHVQANLEAWYDSSMDRVSGWYKRSTHFVLFFIGLFIAVALNIDTTAIARHLYRDTGARDAAVAAAGAVNDAGTIEGIGYEQARAELNALQLPIGWSRREIPPRGPDPVKNFWVWWVVPVMGWLMTAFAATMGAPFWFDILNKVMVIRSTVKPNEKSPNEGSEDRKNDKLPTAGSDGTPPQAPPAAPALPSGAAAAVGSGASAALLASGGAAHGADDDLDGCGAVVDVPTSDEQLPPAHGGVE
ncbi:MAG TPA: hypothetical protein VF647_11625 [Longimicrobium sp.]|jgi:hypothetical protein